MAEWLATGDIVYLAASGPRAQEIARDLAVAAPNSEIVYCPGSDALPGDAAPASPANVGLRVAALRRLAAALANTDRPRIALVTTGEAVARLYPPPAALDAAPPVAIAGEAIDIEVLGTQLSEIGYFTDDRVDEPGEIALRGQVLDVFPADAGGPYRIEVQNGRIAAIRAYDPVSQLTIGETDRLELGRAAEPSIDKGVALVAHLPGAALMIEPGAEERRTRFLALAADAARRMSKRAPREIATETVWGAAIAERVVVPPVMAGDPTPRFVEQRSPLKAFAKAGRAVIDSGGKILLLGHPRDLRFLSARIATALKAEVQPAQDWIAARDAPGGTIWSLGVPAEHGFQREGWLTVAAADLLGSRALRGPAASGVAATGVFDLGDIAIGDVVVHEDHGIGVVDALEPLPDGAKGGGDAIAIRYADGGRRLVPVAEAERIWRYGSDEDAVTLDKLDGASWEKRRGAIDAAIAESARALTALAAERAELTAPKLVPDVGAYERFVSGFPFSETPDQARAIEAVRIDLAAGRPMDRLVIGDVGYGKTEVALRAAAIAALAGYQVAVAAPTTVLARQHIESFTQRFEGTGIVVAGLSRLSSPAELRRVKAGSADGSIHIVIGTAAVAGKTVTYSKLGLVIVDEEQRFGAADKERLRTMGAGHLLTLTATPIPRTLQSALVGLRQLSVIATPPARRQPIRTAVGPFVAETVHTALLREQARGGQSFVVVPRIEDMAPLGEMLAKLAPELEILQAHGKLPATELGEVMVRFGRGDGDVLLATNIIEAGLDVPRANTMIVWRADRFGLSQLHQLRGRVGRANRRGQVMLLTDSAAEIAPRTLKRLRTLEAFDRLGAGFQISARDLDMRGAGDLLGDAQAGHMKLIGIDLYQHLLASALKAARGEVIDRWTPELHLGIEGRLPEAWIPDAALRVTLYARLARIETGGALDAYEAELEDRFGALPNEAKTLIAVARISLAARVAQIARIDAGPGGIAFTPRPGFSGNAEGAGLAAKDGRFLLGERIEVAADRLPRIEAILAGLESD